MLNNMLNEDKFLENPTQGKANCDVHKFSL